MTDRRQPRDAVGRFIPTGISPEQQLEREREYARRYYRQHRARRRDANRDWRLRQARYQALSALTRATGRAGHPEPAEFAASLLEALEADGLRLVGLRTKRGRVAA